MLGLGCFWGAERIFWQLPGVYTTAVGYAGGHHAQPHLRGGLQRAHRPQRGGAGGVPPGGDLLEEILRNFWEGHDPTQGMRQGNDVGTQYRSGIYVTGDAQQEAAEASRDRYAEALAAAGRGGEITTEIVDAGAFYYAEDYHQQYLAKNPNGYCGLGGTGVSCPIGVSSA